MNNTEMVIRAMTSGGGGGGAYYVGLYSTYYEVVGALNDGNVLEFSDAITINTQSEDIEMYLSIQGANYVNLEPFGGGEEIYFSKAYDATGIPAIGKVMLITVYFRPDSDPETRVTYIDPAT